MTENPAAPDTLEQSADLRWCGNRTHLITAVQKGRCRRCNTQTARLSKARNTGAKICENGHGLVQGNVAEDGSCAECAFVEATITAPGAPVRPAPPTWLDWGAVAAALEGRELPRALSLREYACLLHTLQVRRPERSFSEMLEWIGDATTAEISESYANYILNRWWRRYGYPDPRVTLEQAIFAECDGDLWIAEERTRLEIEREAEAQSAPVVELAGRRVSPAVLDNSTNKRDRGFRDGQRVRFCKACAQEKPLSQFSHRAGNMQRNNYCDPCQQGYGLDRHYRREARRHGVPVAKAIVGTGDQRVTRETVVARYGDRCAYGFGRCTGGFDEFSHYVAVKDHGPHTLDNVRPACRSCSRYHGKNPGRRDDAA